MFVAEALCLGTIWCQMIILVLSSHSLLGKEGYIFHLGEIKSQLPEENLNTVILQISRNYVQRSWAIGAFLLFFFNLNLSILIFIAKVC